MPVFPNFAYKGTITGKYDGRNAVATSQSTSTLDEYEAGTKISYKVTVTDAYNNPTNIPETSYISMGMKRQGLKQHRPQFEKMKQVGTYKLTLYEVFRGDYKLSSFLWKNFEGTAWEEYDVKVWPTKVDSDKSVSRTLNDD